MEQRQIAELVSWANKKQTQYKTASSKYYNKNFSIRDDMTPEEKLKVAENIKKRQDYYKRNYEANKEKYKQRAANQRAKKASKLDTTQQITNPTDIITN